MAIQQWVGEIADALSAEPTSDLAALHALPGTTMFFAHLSRWTCDSAHRDSALESARRSMELLKSMPMRLALYGGVAGLAFPLAHLSNLGFEEISLDFSDVDELLLASLEGTAKRPFDLIGGVVGLGAYFLERLPSPVAWAGLQRVVDCLAAIGERDEHGLRWLTSTELLPPDQRATCPFGRYDLGMAHGVPGVIALLSLMIVAGFDRQPVATMLRDTIRWLLRFQRLDSGESSFGTMFDARDEEPPITSRRAAWCYGDPGVSMALYLASRALGDQELRATAHCVARRSTVLANTERHCVFDMSLCHGSEGLAHLFDVLADSFDDEELRSHSTLWRDVTLDLRLPAEGTGGVYFSQVVNERRVKRADASFLEGASGVGLSLLRAIDPNASRSWDRMLLLS